jgi:hypothetical protein
VICLLGLSQEPDNPNALIAYFSFFLFLGIISVVRWEKLKTESKNLEDETIGAMAEELSDRI